MENINIIIILLCNVFTTFEIIISSFANYILYEELSSLILPIILIVALLFKGLYFCKLCNYNRLHYYILNLQLVILCVIATEKDLRQGQLNSSIFFLSSLMIIIQYQEVPKQRMISILIIICTYMIIRGFFLFKLFEGILHLIRIILLLSLLIIIILIKCQKQQQQMAFYQTQFEKLLQIMDLPTYIIISDGNLLQTVFGSNILDKLVEVKLDSLEDIKDSEEPSQCRTVRKTKGHPSTFITVVKQQQNVQLKDFLRSNNTQFVYIEGKEYQIIRQNLFLNDYIFLKPLNQDPSIKQLKELLYRQLHKVSHDMRTPLNAIINMLQCLSELIDPFLRERYLSPSLSSCYLLMNLLSDILDLAQLEKNKIRLVNRKFQLQKMVHKLLKIFEIKAQKKSIRLATHFDPGIPEKITSDKNRLKQILINLISNAFKYTQPQGVITLSFFSIGVNLIKVEVLDTGIGIKEENMKYLFEEFYKINDRQNQIKNPKGVGLGLQISQELALLIGPKDDSGGIKVESKFGQGTKFYFIIQNQLNEEENLEDSQEEELAGYHIRLEESEKRFMPIQKKYTPLIAFYSKDTKLDLMKQSGPKKYSGFNSNSMSDQQLLTMNKKNSQTDFLLTSLANKWNDQLNGFPPILIVDDDEFNIISLQFLLEKFGFSSESAINGREAIQKVKSRQQQRYQLVFMDINMPEIDGEQTAQILLSEDQNLKIIPCSAFESNQQKKKWKQIGMLDPIGKPIIKKKLKQTLYQLFKSEI